MYYCVKPCHYIFLDPGDETVWNGNLIYILIGKLNIISSKVYKFARVSQGSIILSEVIKKTLFTKSSKSNLDIVCMEFTGKNLS